MSISNEAILTLNHLTVAIEGREVVSDLSFELYSGEILGIVGASGSGKSISSLAIMGLLPKQGMISQGEILFKKQNLASLSNTEMQSIRGRKISMIFQEPMTALNPSMRCGDQVAEVFKNHAAMTSASIKAEVISLFEKVQLPSPITVFRKFPHQISGGQQQRVMIAMALACKPDILIADEPTTALDVTVQKEVIELLHVLQKEFKMAIIFISHDLPLVAQLADRVVVMQSGKMVEFGLTKEIFTTPAHPYTKALIKSRPPLNRRPYRLPTLDDCLNEREEAPLIDRQSRMKWHEKLYNKPPLLEVIDLKKNYTKSMQWWSRSKAFKALDEVSFQIYEGETLGLVGESGCGKSTLAKCILLLDPADEGQILYRGQDITKLSKKAFRTLRKDLQIVFQDPYGSLNPRMTVGQAICEPMTVHGLHQNSQRRKQVALELLGKVGLLPEHFERYPHEFSGGQRQRIGIARALAVQPKLIICDESVSALDLSVQAQILNLLSDLQKDFGFSYLFISHDLTVVKYISDRIMVMKDGQIAEIGESDAVYDAPKSSYTQKLIASLPESI